MLFVTQARRIVWIPISFSVLFLVTSVFPVNFAGITRGYLEKHISEALSRYGRPLPLSEDDYEVLMHSLSKKQAQQLNSQLLYLHNTYESGSVEAYLSDDAIGNLYSIGYDFDNAIAEEEEENSDVSLSGCSNRKAAILMPAGYKKLFVVDDENITVSRKGLLSGILRVEVTDSRDTALIGLKELERLDACTWMEMPPTAFKCQGDSSLLVMTYFSIDYDKNKESDMSMSISGYLFRK